MTVWVPRVSRDGRLVVGYRPGPDGTSVALVLDLDSGHERILDRDGTQPVWCGDEILVRPQAESRDLRRYAPDGSSRGAVVLPAPANEVEADDTGEWAAYLGPPYGPRVVAGRLDAGPVRLYDGASVSPAPVGSGRLLAARHADGALVDPDAPHAVLDTRPHRSLRPMRGPGGEYVALVSVDSRWVACVSGHVWPELGTAYAIAARGGYVVIAREPGEIVIAPATDPTRGWIVARGDVRAPDLAVGDDRATVVWCDGRGELGSARVDLGTPRVDVRVEVAPVPPPVETWTPTNDVVDLWRLWIGSAGSQWPRRDPQDHGIYMDCQVTDLGAGRVVATFVKTPDGRVWERRATWRDADGVIWIGLIEDHDRDGRIYHFRDPRLMLRHARAGEIWEWRTDIREWDHPRSAWGPWGPFRFRVRIASVERSSLGRTRATIEVDTYQDLEIFEVLSNKGWSSWEWWRGSAYGTATRKRKKPIPVGLVQRTEWPERFDGPRAWPDPPKTAWPDTTSPVPTRVTIVEPATWPQETPVGSDGLGRLRCVYAVTHGMPPARVRWELWDETGTIGATQNDGSDPDHTFRAPPGFYRIVLVALDANGRELDRTTRAREWIVGAED